MQIAEDYVFIREAVIYMSEKIKKNVLKNGLSEEQVTKSKQEFGTNELAKK